MFVSRRWWKFGTPKARTLEDSTSSPVKETWCHCGEDLTDKILHFPDTSPYGKLTYKL